MQKTSWLTCFTSLADDGQMDTGQAGAKMDGQIITKGWLSGPAPTAYPSWQIGSC